MSDPNNPFDVDAPPVALPKSNDNKDPFAPGTSKDDPFANNDAEEQIDIELEDLEGPSTRDA